MYHFHWRVVYCFSLSIQTHVLWTKDETSKRDDDFTNEQPPRTTVQQLKENSHLATAPSLVTTTTILSTSHTCSWCGIHAVICSWLYELLMSLKMNNKRRVNPFLKTENLIVIYRSIIEPFFTYFCIVWDSISETQIVNLQKL